MSPPDLLCRFGRSRREGGASPPQKPPEPGGVRQVFGGQVDEIGLHMRPRFPPGNGWQFLYRIRSGDGTQPPQNNILQFPAGFCIINIL